MKPEIKISDIFDDKLLLYIKAYKQFGKDYVVPVVREIARIMKPHILSLKCYGGGK